MNPYKLSPSMLTFLWDECPRCFYLQVVLGILRPPAAFPKVFSRIDSLMKGLFANQPSSKISAELPPGKVAMQGKWVTSEPLRIPGIEASCYIRGAFDSVVAFDDGSYAVIDFKTSQPNPDHVEFYGRQLHAYAYALEHPAAKAIGLHPVERLGLLYLDPVDIDHSQESRRIIYGGEVTWVEIPLVMDQFIDFMKGVLSVLSLKEPPPAAEGCVFCAYREEARKHGL